MTTPQSLKSGPKFLTKLNNKRMKSVYQVAPGFDIRAESKKKATAAYWFVLLARK